MRSMRIFCICLLMALVQFAYSQKYFSKAGKVSFYSDAPMEKIEAHNTTASSVMDISTGNVEWGVLIKGFEFEKALMKEHFNENYMESHKYPKAVFKGKISNLSDVSFTKDGEYPVTVAGQLEIHGVTKPISTNGIITVKNGKISGTSQFTIKVADYNIEIPKLVAENIAKDVTIKVQVDYQPLDAVR